MEDPMKYVKLRAKSYNEALMQLRMKYGEDAIPISHKYVKEGGILGGMLFSKQLVELTAAYQERGLKTKPAAPMQTPLAPKKKGIDLRADDDVTKSFLSSADQERDPGDFLRELKKAANNASVYGSDGKRVVPAASDPLESEPVRKVERPAAASGDIILSKEEYQALKKYERDFSDVKERLDRLMDESGTVSGKSASLQSQYEELAAYEKILARNDIDEQKCREILDSIKRSLSAEDLKDKVKIDKSFKELLKSRIVVTGPIKPGSRRKIIMFVGPTGVGKTTSLAKLGAIFSLREEKRVAFVTIDTYRIAATEQLKKYADIMKIPVHVVNDQREFKSIMDKEKADIILIDTSGRSYRNAMKISEIKSYADSLDCEFEKILCVSASTKKADLESIFNSFGKLDFTSVMVTKADETNYIGNIIDIADTHSKPISYITNGQEVPNDIIAADAEKLADMMISGITD
jgi:flagellar biosynthesis protein FlhF